MCKASKYGALLWIVTSLAAADVAGAATFQYGSYDLTNEQNIHITSPFTADAGLGQIVLHGSGPNAGQTILAWCLDIYNDLQSSGTYTVQPITTAGTGGSNPPLTTTQIGQIGALVSHGNALISTDFNVSAAVQLALWEIEYSSFNSNGVNPTVAALAASYITNVQNGTWAPNFNIALLTERYNQSLVFVTPLPPTFVMFFSALAGLGGLLFRRQRRIAATAGA